jgi:manganese/zinc/iron transport system substrate-binding protein
LITSDPTHKIEYEANTRQYLQKLEDLHNYVKKKCAQVPKNNKVLITAHDAFSYFGKAYNFQVKGIQGISTTSEAGTKDIKNLAEFVAQKKIPAVFVETSVPQRYVESLQAAVKAKGFAVKIGGHLYSDSMGDKNTPQGTYIGMVHHNVDTIVQALKK